MTEKIEITVKHLKDHASRKKARDAGHLVPRRRPYTVSIGPGVRLGYRCNQGADGTWVWLAADGSGGTTTRALGAADDRVMADNDKILDYGQAFRKALDEVIGSTVELGADGKQIKVTVEFAAEQYARALAKRNADPRNASVLKHHLRAQQAFAKKRVGVLTKRDIETFQEALMAEGLKRATVNRDMIRLEAALNLAAKDFPAQVTKRPWAEVDALTVPPHEVSDTVLLSDKQIEILLTEVQRRHDMLCANWVWVHAETGQRTVQVNQLNIEDLRDAHTDSPWLLMWTSSKGVKKVPTQDLVVPITTALADRLLAAAGNRAPNEPLLLNSKGRRVQDGDIYMRKGKKRNLVSEIAREFNFPKTKQGNVVTLYALRHSSIIRMLRNPELNAYEVARRHDSSIKMLQQHYASEMHKSGGDRVRRTLPEISIGGREGNVTRLQRRA